MLLFQPIKCGIGFGWVEIGLQGRPVVWQVAAAQIVALYRIGEIGQKGIAGASVTCDILNGFT